MRTEDYRWGRNIPRMAYTLDDLAYAHQKARECADVALRDGYERVAAMIARKLGVSVSRS